VLVSCKVSLFPTFYLQNERDCGLWRSANPGTPGSRLVSKETARANQPTPGFNDPASLSRVFDRRRLCIEVFKSHFTDCTNRAVLRSGGLLRSSNTNVAVAAAALKPREHFRWLTERQGPRFCPQTTDVKAEISGFLSRAR